ACYETATWNSTTCAWDVTGTQPPAPTVACYETATWNSTTCAWDVTGTQPTAPTVACYETATWNATTCQYDVTGTQPIPTFNAIAPICSGATLTLPTTSNEGITGTWSPAVNNTATTTYTFTPDAGECAGMQTMTVTVSQTPSFTSATSKTICSGESTNLALTASPSSATFTWTANAQSGVSGASSGSGTAINQVLTSLTGGTVTYSVTPTIGTCAGTPTNVVVTVTAMPAISVTPQTASVCQGSSVNLTASGGSIYTWSPATGLSPTTGANVTATPSATTTYTVTGVDASNCAGTSQVTITVTPIPTVTTSANVALCLGETTTLTASGATSYSWSPATGLSAATGASVTATPMTTTTYVVTGTTNGCSSLDSVTVTVNPIPVVDAGADQNVCSGAPITLTATGAVTYSWDNNVTDGVSFISDSTRTYTVIGTDANGCQNTDFVTINVLDAPVVAFTSDTTEGCAPSFIQFINNSPGATSYFWDFGDGTTSTLANPSHNYEKEGCYDVSFSANNGACSITVTETNYICVKPTPTAGFVTSTTEITNVMNEVFFANQSKDATSYEWYFGDESGYSTQTNPKYTYDPTMIRNHTVVLVARNDDGCTDTARIIIHMKGDVVFYVPNTFTPDGDQFNNVFKPIIAEGFDAFGYELLIFNRWGELVFESHDPDYGWDGTYLGKICQDGTYTWKINIKKIGVDERFSQTGHITLIR
ncbi:MAG TPA: PKD domain-containing protein, partial [Crocinitomicaceae bacterium]|nr:PKD domain-containing protein [Crocinitomicaceae bacterium]